MTSEEVTSKNSPDPLNLYVVSGLNAASEFAELPEDMELELGMTLMSGHGPFRVVGITDTLIKCDFNHPLSGRALKFEVEVVDVRDASEEELEHGHVHGEGGHQH